MDTSRFDQVAKLVSRGVSRRASLGLLLATMAGLPPLMETDAKQRQERARQRRPKKCRAPRRKCGRTCVAVQTDRNNCGACRNACGAGQACRGGVCEGTCTPDCAGKTCGGNGCGGSCGTCSGGRICSNPGNGGTCQCPAAACNGECCAGGQQCFGTACWPDDQESAFVSLINTHRAQNGRSPLALQNQLGQVAELHSQDQAANNFSSHRGSDGSSPDQRITRAGYAFSWWAENIYFGGPSAQEAFTWWRQSSGHNTNMLDANLTQLGIARARSSSGTWYWTTTFGRPR